MQSIAHDNKVIGVKRQKRENNHLIRYTAITTATLLFLLVYSYYTSPLTTQYGFDAAFYQLVGQGMTKGYLPYRDFYDMKGPYFFLFQQIGQYLYYGRTGCFLIQFVFLFVSILLIDKTYRLVLGNRHMNIELMLILPCFLVASYTFQGGNLTEEFSLPFLLGCLYLCLRYILNNKTRKRHNPVYAFIYGASFSILALVRITNAAGICAIILTILIALIQYKEWKNIFHNAIAFIAGALVAAAPVCIFYHAHGILGEMLNAVFVFGFQYASEGDGIVNDLFVCIRDQSIYFFPSFIAFAVMFIFHVENKQYWLLSVSSLFATFIAVTIGNGYLHYLAITIPTVVLGLWIFAESWINSGDCDRKNMPKETKKRIRVSAVVIAIVLCTQLYSFAGATLHACTLIVQRNENSKPDSIERMSQNIVASIPENEKDSVYTYGISSRWYCMTGLFPCIRYLDWQDHYIALNPNIAAELQTRFEENPPKWLVFHADYIPASFFAEYISSDYTVFARNDLYMLYHLNRFNEQPPHGRRDLERSVQGIVPPIKGRIREDWLLDAAY